LALLGQTIDGREAHRIGLAVELAPLGGHEAAALRLAEEALKGAPLAIAAQKQLLDGGLAMSLDAVQDFEVQTSFRLTLTEDHQEPKKAFAGKRSPVFRGRGLWRRCSTPASCCPRSCDHRCSFRRNTSTSTTPSSASRPGET